jgi:hypothetical protein
MSETIILPYNEAISLTFPNLDIDFPNACTGFSSHKSNASYQCVSLYWTGVQNETHQYGIVVIRRMRDTKHFAARISRMRDTCNLPEEQIENVFGVIGVPDINMTITYKEVERVPHQFAKNRNPLFIVI